MKKQIFIQNYSAGISLVLIYYLAIGSDNVHPGRLVVIGIVAGIIGLGIIKCLEILRGQGSTGNPRP